jgi:hypothetical protein
MRLSARAQARGSIDAILDVGQSWFGQSYRMMAVGLRFLPEARRSLARRQRLCSERKGRIRSYFDWSDRLQGGIVSSCAGLLPECVKASSLSAPRRST